MISIHVHQAVDVPWESDRVFHVAFWVTGESALTQGAWLTLEELVNLAEQVEKTLRLSAGIAS